MTMITTSRVSSGIHLYHDDYLQHYKMESALMRINNRPNGKALLNKITQLSSEDKLIKISVDYDLPTLNFGELSEEQQQKFNVDPDKSFLKTVMKAEQVSHKKGFMRKGEGVGSQIRWNPTSSRSLKDGKPLTDEWERDSFVSLAHELIHSMRMLNGTSKLNDFRQFPERDGRNEELRVIGTNRYAFKRISENGIRQEHGLPRRDG